MVQRPSLLKRGKEGGDWHFSNSIFSRFIIFTFRNYFISSSSANISSWCLVHPAADDYFLYVKTQVWTSAGVAKWCLVCPEADEALLNYFTLCKIVLCIFCSHHNFMKSHSKLPKKNLKIFHKLRWPDVICL